MRMVNFLKRIWPFLDRFKGEKVSTWKDKLVLSAMCIIASIISVSLGEGFFAIIFWIHGVIEFVSSMTFHFKGWEKITVIGTEAELYESPVEVHK